MDNKEKLIIYQVFPRIFTNTCDACVHNGSIDQNGVGIAQRFKTECKNCLVLVISNMLFKEIGAAVASIKYASFALEIL